MVPPDFSLSITRNNGSVPPRHRRSSRTQLRADGSLRIVTKHGYDGDGEATEHILDAAAVGDLLVDLRRLGVFSTVWQEPERRAIGGGQWRLRVTADGDLAEIPAAVLAEQREDRDRIRARIRRVLAGEG